MISDYKFASYFLSSLIIIQTITFVVLVFIFYKDTRNLNVLLCASWLLLIFPEIVQILNYSNNIFIPFIPELSNYLFYGISISIFLLVFFAKKELEFKRIFQIEKNALSGVEIANERKEKFIKMIIERLMTPIDTISELSKDLIEKRDDIEISEYNAKIRSLLKRSKILGNLIHDIRDYDQIEHGELLLNLNKFDLYSLVTSSILAIQPSIVHRNIIIVNNVNNKLPFIEADEKRIKQVVLNFLNTIIQNMVEGTININAGEKGNQVLFSIDFDDPGIELDVLNAFFVPYDYLVQTEDGHLFGSNLYVSKKIIQMHGGHVKLEKKNGRIRFYFILKILENQNEIGNFIDVFKRNWSEYYISDSPLSMSRTGVSFGLIFVIDDDITILENITGFLESVGYEIRAFQNPKNVIEAINENKPDLIITDTIMPYMSGYELCIQIRKIFTEAELPILLLATFDKTDELMVSIDSGVNDYITKPVSREQLLARVKLTINLSNITRAYERFVPSEFIRLINKNSIAEIKLGDHVERELTILFSDIRAFTHISEKMTAQENFSFLNSYLNKVGPVIRNNNGFIDKYIGDAIMALFSGTADDAVNAAIEMQRKIREHNYINKSNNEQIIRVGIGIHTGNVIIGTIGENQRMEGTVVSDAVNLTSRLENLTKLYGCNILISMDTFLNLEDSEKFNYRILDRVKVKGKEKFITVIEIIDGYSQTKVKKLLDSKIHFEEGIAHYLSREFDAAIAKFKKVLSIIADDEASIIYIQRSEYYKNHVLPKNWDGVEILEEKFY
jgi:two-component system sensor histidine kinase ChiS